MTASTTTPERIKLDLALDAVVKGDVVVPNLQEISAIEAVAAIACFGSLEPRAGRARIAIAKHWARYFVSRTQRGAIDGTGYVLWWDQGKGRAAKFAICVHDSVPEPGGNPRRGWAPSRCSKCGLNTSVDSSD